MTTFDVVIILGGACGIVMVVGGMVLLYTGAISLDKASKAQAASLQFKKLIRVTTHYPALGLFIIGLAFIVSAAALSHSEQRSFTISGQLNPEIDDPGSLRVTIGAPRTWEGSVYKGGEIVAQVTPTTDILEVTLTAPGYRQVTLPVQTRKSKFGTIAIGDIALKQVVGRLTPNPDNIAPAPGELPALKQAGAF